MHLQHQPSQSQSAVEVDRRSIDCDNSCIWSLPRDSFAAGAIFDQALALPRSLQLDAGKKSLAARGDTLASTGTQRAVYFRTAAADVENLVLLRVVSHHECAVLYLNFGGAGSVGCNEVR